MVLVVFTGTRYLFAGTRTVYRTSHDDIVHDIHLFNISTFTHKSTLANQHVVVDIHSNVDGNCCVHDKCI